jgi:hypothetical protein
MFSVIFSFLLIILYTYIIYLLIYEKKYNFIFILLVASSIIQVLDKPFYIQIELSDIIGLTFLLFKRKLFKDILLTKTVLLFSLIFIIPIFIGFINVLIPFEYTSFNFISRTSVFIKASLRVLGILGSIYFLLYYLSKEKKSIELLKKILLYSFLISSVSGLIIYLNFKSPYFYFKGASYTPDGEESFLQYRISGFCYEPRMLGYFAAINYFLIDTINFKKIFRTILKIFSIVILILTFSISGMIFFCFIYFINYIFFKGLSVFLKQTFIIAILASILYILFYENINILLDVIVNAFNKRVIFEKDLNFNFFPSFLSNLERHDLPIIYYFDNNLSNIIFGFGYGLTRIFMGPFSWVSDLTGEGFNLKGTATCCEAHVGFVYFLGVGGLIFLFLWLFLFVKSSYLLHKNWERLNKYNKSFFALISVALLFLIFQIPQSSIVTIYYFLYFNNKLIFNKITNE